MFSRLHPVLPDDIGIEDEELDNWTDTRLPMVRWRNRFWIVKSMSSEAIRRELLVYALCKGFCNTPEVRKVGKRLFSLLTRQDTNLQGNDRSQVILIEVAQTVDEQSLPNQSLDAATAAELVFSLWIRRRDVDIWNRSYAKNGLPIFYDLNACLDFEEKLRDINDFFSYNRYGYAGSWRVKEIGDGDDLPLSTVALRTQKDHTNYINRKQNFKREIEKVKEIVKGINLDDDRLYRKAGYKKDEVKKMRQFLMSTQITLDGDVEKLCNIIFSETAPDLDNKDLQ